MLENQIDYLSSFNQELITPLTAKFISEQLTHPTYLSPSEFIKLNTLTYDLLAQSFNGSLRDYLQYLNQSVEIARSEGIDEFFNKEGIEIKGKPLLIIPPYVLGYDILAFLPNEGKSFVHELANNGIPTYIRIIKPILKTPSVQTMFLENECEETKEFSQKLLKKHGSPVTLAGYCQGGFTAMLSCLSGKLEKEVDALITFVSPMDGTKSTGINKYLMDLPDSFKSLKYATRILSNGNKIIETADLSYAISVTSQGDLPVKLFNQKLNFRDISKYLKACQLNISTLDNLVEPECARVPAQFSDLVEIVEHKTGHVGIALSPSKFLSPAIEFLKKLSE